MRQYPVVRHKSAQVNAPAICIQSFHRIIVPDIPCAERRNTFFAFDHILYRMFRQNISLGAFSFDFQLAEIVFKGELAQFGFGF